MIVYECLLRQRYGSQGPLPVKVETTPFTVCRRFSEMEALSKVSKNSYIIKPGSMRYASLSALLLERLEFMSPLVVPNLPLYFIFHMANEGTRIGKVYMFQISHIDEEMRDRFNG
jgi:hypothetical protein